MTFERPVIKTILKRLKEDRRRIQILFGARQVGKTTLILQALKQCNQPHLYKIAEGGHSVSWIDQQWAQARALSKTNPDGCILVIDEVQKISNWSERVKRLWDEDTAAKSNVKVVLLGSSALLLHKGLSESMAGRYERIHIPHWSFQECLEAFDISLNDYVYYGAYPGALVYRKENARFLAYMKESIIEPIVSRDILSQYIIHKPALLRQLFHLGCTYSSQMLSYNKMLGQLQDAGNTTTLAHYLTLLHQSEVLTGLPKYTQDQARQRKSSPKFQVFNNALMTASLNSDAETALNNAELKGRLVESMIGAHLLNQPDTTVYYWRENNYEVDFVVNTNGKTIALEVKSNHKKAKIQGLERFQSLFNPDAVLLVGADGIPLETFLTIPLQNFV